MKGWKGTERQLDPAEWTILAVRACTACEPNELGHNETGCIACAGSGIEQAEIDVAALVSLKKVTGRELRQDVRPIRAEGP